MIKRAAQRHLTEVNKIVESLFRHKAGQLTSTLTRIFGTSNIDIAETVVQEAFLKACQTWPYSGIPENPSGWLTTVAKNQALDLIRKEQRFRRKEDDILRWYERQIDTDLTQIEIEDSDLLDDQLRLIFLCCHSILNRKAQVSLTLKIAAGFSVREIARAFLSDEEATRKLLFRAKQKIREEGIPFELPAKPELSKRVDAVLEVLYLIFNEGYNAYKGDILIRQDFCNEAIRLTGLFLKGSLSNSPKIPTVKALLALMLFHASRIPARADQQGEIIVLADQDRTLWDKKAIALGVKFLRESACGVEISPYHLQAHIAACHATAASYDQADWIRILSHYDQLLAMTGNPVVALNRTVALSKVMGAQAALLELQTLADKPLLKDYYLLPATFADFYRLLGENQKAILHYNKALQLTENQAEQRFLEKRIQEVSR